MLSGVERGIEYGGGICDGPAHSVQGTRMSVGTGKGSHDLLLELGEPFHAVSRALTG
jgi:hypothetical protein